MAKINILALGGLDEKQRRLYILEIDSKIYILDSGVYEPLNNDFGIQHFVPNTDYLTLNRDKIKAVFLSSADRMNLGSVLQIVKIKKDVQICGSKTTIDSLDVFFKDQTQDWNKVIYDKGETKTISGIDIKAIALPANIPGTFGYQFKTEDGNVLYFSNYIFDSVRELGLSPISELSDLLKDKNLLLISDSSKSTEKVALSSKFRIRELVKKFFLKDKRLIISIYEDEIINAIELIKLSQENKKKIFFKSQTLYSLLKIMMANGEIESFPIRSYSEYRAENATSSVIILSGTRTKLYKSIESIIESNNIRDFAFHKDDTLYFAALPQSGNEHVFADVINKISRIDLSVIKPSPEEKKLFGTTEFDIRNMINLIKPIYFMPVSAYYTELAASKQIAIENGVNDKNIIIGENGEIFTINKGIYEGLNQKIKNIEPKVIESIGENSIKSELIDERKSIGKDGVVTISFLYSVKDLALCSEIDIQMKGVVISKGQERTIEKVKAVIITTSDELSETKQNIKKGIPSMKKAINRVFRESFKKTPTLIFNIMEK